MTENSAPKAAKAAADKSAAAAQTMAKEQAKVADAATAAVRDMGAAASKASQPMMDVLDRMAKMQAEFAQRMGFDPKSVGFDPAKLGFDPSKFGMDKMFGDNMPRFDLMLGQHQKNVETFFKAQVALVDGVQSVYQRQLALLQQTLGEAVSLMQSLMAEKDSRKGVEKQVDASKKAFEKIMGEAKELGDVVSKSQTEAFKLLNHRALEQMEEIKAAYDKSA